MREPRHNPEQQQHDDALLITRYCDGLLSPAEFEQLNVRLATDPALRQLFIDLTIQAEHIETVLTRPEAVFDEFAYIPPADDTKVSPRTLALAGGYLLDKALHSRAVTTALAAAVVVLAGALVLVLAFDDGGETPTTTTSNSSETSTTSTTPTAPITPVEPLVVEAPVVAQLTGTHLAEWDDIQDAPNVGEDLRSGQRLTLTAGFAEITTVAGAIAILKAPATIEMIDSPNALRLHTGKLVGICETDSSKGFLVRTPHMDITDLGTRFGINASEQRYTEVSVFQGEVQIDTPRYEPQTLFANHTAWSVADDSQAPLIVKNQAVDTFDALLANRLVDPLAGFRPRFASGNIVWGGELPGDLDNEKQVSDSLQVFLEQQAIRLEQEVQIDLASPTPASEQNGSHQPTIAAGQQVDVYLLHLDFPGSANTTPVTYTLHFDRPILGLITTGENLYQTDPTLGVAATQYPRPEKQEQIAGRGLESTANPDGDRATIDGQTLRLTLSAGGYIDQLRVLVEPRSEVSE